MKRHRIHSCVAAEGTRYSFDTNGQRSVSLQLVPAPPTCLIGCLMFWLEYVIREISQDELVRLTSRISPFSGKTGPTVTIRVSSESFL